MTLQGGFTFSGVDLGITGLDYAVVTVFFVSWLGSILRSRRVRPLNLALAGFYLVIWLMSILWGPLLLKGLTTLYALVIAALMIVVWRKQSPQLGPGRHQ